MQQLCNYKCFIIQPNITNTNTTNKQKLHVLLKDLRKFPSDKIVVLKWAPTRCNTIMLIGQHNIAYIVAMIIFTPEKPSQLCYFGMSIIMFTVHTVQLEKRVNICRLNQTRICPISSSD